MGGGSEQDGGSGQGGLEDRSGGGKQGKGTASMDDGCFWMGTHSTEVTQTRLSLTVTLGAGRQ